MRQRFFRRHLLPRTHRIRPRFQISHLQTIAAAAQSVAIASAVIVGGAWTLYTFRAQLYVENARAQLQKLARDSEAAPRLEIDISTVQLDVPGSPGLYVLGTVNVKNVGSADTVLNFQKEPVRIYRVTVGKVGESWSDERSLNLKIGRRAMTGGLVCHAGATTHANFIAEIGAAGLYVVNFSAIRNASEAATVKLLGANVKEPEEVEWQAQHYFTVREPPVGE